MIIKTKQADGTWKTVLDNDPFYTNLNPEQLENLKGDRGADGADGKSAFEVAVEQGYREDVDTWLTSLKGEEGQQGPEGPMGEAGQDGADGLSAYDIAKKNGFTGDEQTWLDSLKGKDGDSSIAAITPKGVWSADATYDKSDYVTHYNGSTYVCILDGTTGIDPIQEGAETNWQLIALAGAKGEKGATPRFTVTAEVKDTTSSPNVTVTQGGTDEAPELKFDFYGIGSSDNPNFVKYGDVKKADMGAYLDRIQEIANDPDNVKYSDIKKVDMDYYISELERRTQDPDNVKYPDISAVNMDQYLEQMEGMLQNPDLIKNSDVETVNMDQYVEQFEDMLQDPKFVHRDEVDTFDMDQFVKNIEDRQTELEDDYGKLSLLDFNLFTASAETNTDRSVKEPTVSVTRNNEHFKFNFDGIVSYGEFEEFDFQTWVDDISKKQQKLDDTYGTLAEIDLDSILKRLSDLETMIRNNGAPSSVPDLTAERIIGTIDGVNVYEKVIKAVFPSTKTGNSGNVEVANIKDLDINKLISATYTSRKTTGVVDTGNSWISTSNYSTLIYTESTGSLTLYWYVARTTAALGDQDIYITIRYTKN